MLKSKTKTDDRPKPEAKTEAPEKTEPKSRGKFALEAKITLIAKENPKREGSKSHARFEKYKTGQTVEEALKAGLRHDDFRHDTKKGFVRIS